MYITVPGSPITETVYASSNGASVAGGESVTKGGPVISGAFTETITNPVISTQVISVVQASSVSVSKDKGPYSFFENNGTTIWLGCGTPPPSIPFVTATSYVTLEPVPMSAVVSAVSGAQTTKHLTILSTHKPTKYFTDTLAASTVSASGNAYTGLGWSGWNTTTLVTLKSEASGSGFGKPTVVLSDKHVSFHATGYPKTLSTGFLKRRLEGRNLGDVVIATVDGVVVSWSNSYAGTSPTSSTSLPASKSSAKKISRRFRLTVASYLEVRCSHLSMGPQPSCKPNISSTKYADANIIAFAYSCPPNLSMGSEPGIKHVRDKHSLVLALFVSIDRADTNVDHGIKCAHIS